MLIYYLQRATLCLLLLTDGSPEELEGLFGDGGALLWVLLDEVHGGLLQGGHGGSGEACW